MANMQNLWYTLTHHWNFARVVRLLIGLLILWQSIMNRDGLMISMAVFFTSMALFTTGCCGVGNCTTDIDKNQQETKTVQYEEIK